MNKRGELSLRFLILLIIGLIVLILVILIFQDRIADFVSTISELFSDFGGQATEASKGLAE